MNWAYSLGGTQSRPVIYERAHWFVCESAEGMVTADTHLIIVVARGVVVDVGAPATLRADDRPGRIHVAVLKSSVCDRDHH